MKIPNLFMALAIVALCVSACNKNEEDYRGEDYLSEAVEIPLTAISERVQIPSYKTENVIILVIDGPRYSETWGDPTHENIPVWSEKLAKSGVVNTAFYNHGETWTIAGHTAVTTGVYQEIHNGGKELPQFPSLFQHWSAANDVSGESSYVIASKDKLDVLSDTGLAKWSGKFRPISDCGKSGPNSGYRKDSTTYENTFRILSEKHPKLMLINLKDPDFYAHRGDKDNYLQGIKNSDAFMGELWDFLQQDEFYANKTTLFMTNDHGRHGDGNRDGFISHGDGCLECRHLNFFALGPDFKKDVSIDLEREQIDIPATVSELMGFEMPFGQGEVMVELFK